MLYSMTGYGQAKSRIGGRSCAVELRSVNHRYLDISVRLPASLNSFESELRKLIGEKLKRGKINVCFNWNGANDVELEIDAKRIAYYVRKLRSIGRSLKLDPAFSVSDLVNLPNAFSSNSEKKISGREWVLARGLVRKALTRLLEMRAREGAQLVRDVENRLKKIRQAVAVIGKLSKQLPNLYKEKLSKRIEELSGGVCLDPEALAKEVALFADRSDITEELVRLDHHLRFFRKTLHDVGEVGKRLDFISQEIHRETNTMASKSAHHQIQKYVISIKTEVEKIREQIQNIE
ncbi:MAG: YicC family protein [Candidatus Omnitrophica bacterium]|nr:YicC family protein [Candidatus Omnitrophota bacterium]